MPTSDSDKPKDNADVRASSKLVRMFARSSWVCAGSPTSTSSHNNSPLLNTVSPSLQCFLKKPTMRSNSSSLKLARLLCSSACRMIASSVRRRNRSKSKRAPVAPVASLAMSMTAARICRLATTRRAEPISASGRVPDSSSAKRSKASRVDWISASRRVRITTMNSDNFSDPPSSKAKDCNTCCKSSSLRKRPTCRCNGSNWSHLMCKPASSPNILNSWVKRSDSARRNPLDLRHTCTKRTNTSKATRPSAPGWASSSISESSAASSV
mmetsp:Transcript_120243/g.345651  ORF Transcript_120243/g.345651 Transcript_120243/m.345651 type:complete len:268 (-) Transcript_120243:1151-1954(-)